MAPLGDEPMAVRALPETAAAVARLAELPDTTVAFVSGRQLADLRVIAAHDDRSPIWLTGSHGVEHWRPAAVAQPVPDQAAAGEEVSAAALVEEAQRSVEGIDGAWVEPKAYGFALHTRLASPDDGARARSGVDAMVAERAPEWRRRTGKDIAEYTWRHEGKDAGVARLRDETAATAVLFAGDDVTDEDALRSLREGDLGVRVGDGETAASVRVSGPLELAELLTALADARAS
ncbi:trehalose-phosphatase [Microbacterium marinilacus]|nr:trehalose-phosphatase [Microbacterium marinilacus]